MKRLKDKKVVPEAKLGTLLKTFTSSKKKTRLHCARPRRMGTPGCVNKRAGGKRVRGGFRSKFARMVSKRDLNSAELETTRTLKGPTTVMTANGDVQTREEATVRVKHLDLFVKSYASRRNTRSSCTREAL